MFSVSSPSIAAIVYRSKVIVLLLDCFSGMALQTDELMDQTGVTVYDYGTLCEDSPIVGIVLDERELEYVATEHTVFLPSSFNSSCLRAKP